MDIHFHGYKIRYDILNEKFLPIVASHNIKSINIFINLDDFYHKLHRPLTEHEFECSGNSVHKQIVSNIINLIGHYKRWAIKEGISPTIYLIHSSSTLFRNSMYSDGYRDYYKDISTNMNYHSINSAISNTNPLLEVIIKYIKNAYIINSNYIEPSCIPLYLSTIRKADWNFIISRDEYDLQYSYKDRWTYISPKGDNSRVIYGSDIWKHLLNKSELENIETKLDPEIFILAKSIIGDKYRNIPKLTRSGWKTIINYITKICDKNALYSIESQKNALNDFISSKKVSMNTLHDNLNVLDVEMQINRLLEVDRTMIEYQMVDMEDNNALVHLNTTIFKDYPINIPFITDNKPHQKIHRYNHWKK